MTGDDFLHKLCLVHTESALKKICSRHQKGISQSTLFEFGTRDQKDPAVENCENMWSYSNSINKAFEFKQNIPV